MDTTADDCSLPIDTNTEEELDTSSDIKFPSVNPSDVQDLYGPRFCSTTSTLPPSPAQSPTSAHLPAFIRCPAPVLLPAPVRPSTPFSAPAQLPTPKTQAKRREQQRARLLGSATTTTALRYDFPDPIRSNTDTMLLYTLRPCWLPDGTAHRIALRHHLLEGPAAEPSVDSDAPAR